MSVKKNSIKTEYAPLFRILYWSTIGFFFAVLAWMAFEGVMNASNGIQEHDRVSREYRQAMERNKDMSLFPAKRSSSSKPPETQADETESKEENPPESDDYPI